MVIIGLLLHGVVGYVYLTSGLGLPGQLLIPLWVSWLVLLVLAVVNTRRPWLVLAVPFIAVAVLLAVGYVGCSFVRCGA